MKNWIHDLKEGESAFDNLDPKKRPHKIVDGKIVGTVLCGHDGRRGFIHHMAVAEEYRRHSIAKRMALKALDALSKDGIKKTHIFCYTNNELGQSFWKALDWKKREDVFVFSFSKEL